MDKKKLFIYIGVFWLVVVLGFIGFKEFTLQTGEEVLFRTRPVDPRDLFRGDYVILNYEISSVDHRTLTTDAAGFSRGDRVYVALDIVDGYGTPTGIFRQQPAEGLFIKGTVQSADSSTLGIEYGIESYFVPEGEGRELERAAGNRLDVQASVDKFGNAVIKSVLIDGKAVDFKPGASP